MTVEAITRKAGPYDYTSGAAYPFAFKVFNKTDVYVVVTENDVESIITLDANYTVTLNDDQDNNPGGYVSLITQYGSHCKITIGSGVPYNQGLVLTNKGGFYPDTLNKAYDKLTILCQQLLEQVSRCIKVNLSSSLSAEDYKAQLEDTANDAAESAASAALSAQDAASSAAVAAETANEALTKANTAVETSNEALASIIPGVNQAIENLHIPDMVSDNVDDKIESLDLDTQIYNEVVSAISDVTIPGLSPATITGALGYKPYDAETNSKGFATTTEVSDAIAAIPNADWNATEGPGEILNKPGDFSGATADSAGEQGLVPAPGAGDQAKYLNGAGDWVEISNATNEKAGLARPDGETVTVDENGVFSALAPIGTVYVQFSGQTAPADLYGGTWENISAQFAGMFFRAEGGNSAAFGSTQSDGAPNIIGTAGWSVGGNASWGPNFSGALSASRSGTGMTRAESGAGDITISIDANRSNSKYGSATEFRPYNSTIRIWKRTA